MLIDDLSGGFGVQTQDGVGNCIKKREMPFCTSSVYTPESADAFIESLQEKYPGVVRCLRARDR